MTTVRSHSPRTAGPSPWRARTRRSACGTSLSGKEIDCLNGHSDWVLSVAFSPDGQTLVSCGSDQKSLVWDLSKIAGTPAGIGRAVGRRNSRRTGRTSRATPRRATPRWAGSSRPPNGAVPFLGKRLETAAAADTKPIERLIARPGRRGVQVRERATKELEAMGDRAAPALRAALAGGPSPEAKRRLEALLRGWRCRPLGGDAPRGASGGSCSSRSGLQRPAESSKHSPRGLPGCA